MDTAFVYIMHDESTGWMKLGYSGIPYDRTRQVRRDYEELVHAELLGVVRTKYYMELESWLYQEVKERMVCAGGTMIGERFRWPAKNHTDHCVTMKFMARELLMDAYKQVEEIDAHSTVWSCWSH